MLRFPRILSAACLAFTCLAVAPPARADDWPQWLGPRRDGVWRETGILKKFPPGGPKILWQADVGGGYAGPAVAGGRVYVTDRVLGAGQNDPDNPFQRTTAAGKERVLCFDARTGKPVWKHEYPCKYAIQYPAGPRATPIVEGGKVYTLGAMGDLICLDAGKGTVVWSHDLMKEYKARVPVWGFAAHPLIDGDQLICLVGRNPTVVSFDKATGKEKWRALELESSEIGYCPPMIYTIGGRRQLIIWHPESVNGLDPATGKVLWTHDWSIRANLTVSTPLQVGDRLFLTSFYNGSRLLEITGKGEFSVKEIWASKVVSEDHRRTDTLNSIIPTPVIKDGHVYGVCSYGQLRCLTLDRGKRVWSELTATGAGKAPERWANAFLIPQGDRYFLFNEKGDLIIARLSPRGYEEIDRAHILDPTGQLPGGFSSPRKVLWSHPAFAGRAMFARNDKKIIAVSLAAE